MFFLRATTVFLAVFFTAVFCAPSIDIKATEDATEDYRLPLTILPINYNIALRPYLFATDGTKQFTFDGEAYIEIVPQQSTNTIIIHSKNLQYTLREYYSKDTPNTKKTLTATNVNEVTDKVTYTLTENLEASKSYILHFVYTGSMDDDMHGFYRSSYTDSNNQVKWIGSTQFQNNHARRAFPSFDEPKFKATFDISLTRHKDMHSVSNSKLKSSTPVANSDYVTDVYEQTPKMSPYIVAFLISEFKERTNSQFTVIARPEYYDQTQYSFEVGQKLLASLETYFGIHYYDMGINKMHMAAIPDFSAGAMENWGLLTYRERGLLYDENSTTLSSKQYIASVVAHEQTHMWFGDLVTCDWWSYTWLNEGFARYFQYFGTAKVETELDMDKQFVVAQVQVVMNLDSTASSNPMSDEDTNTPSDLRRMLNTISYNKGATFIRMVKHVMGEANFQKSLQEYLNANKYKNTVPQNLFDYWIKYWPSAYAAYATPLFKSFTEQVGYPVLNVELASDGNSFSVSQKRFLLRDDDGADASLLYTVPVTYTTDKQKDFSTTTTKLFLEANTNKKVVSLPSSANWIIANIQEVGFYRVNYDENNWGKIRQALLENNWSGIHELNRAQIVDDLFNLARSNHISYSLALNVLEYLSTEMNYLPWTSALNGYSYLAIRLGTDNKNFATYILQLLDNVYKYLGFEERSTDKALDIYNRANILDWACKYGNTECIAQAKEKFQNLKTTAVPVNIRAPVYCTAMREGNLADFNTLFQKYQTETVATEQTLILTSLGCVKDQTLIERYFNIIMSSEVRLQDKSSALSGLYTQNNENVNPVFDLVTANVAKVAEEMGGYSSVATVISNIAARFTEESQQTKLKEFNNKNKAAFGSSASTLEAAETTVAANLLWASNRLVHFKQYLTLKAVSDGYRLPTTILPKNYKIKLQPYLLESDGSKRFTFDGEVHIEIVPQENTNAIVMHTKNLIYTTRELWSTETPTNIISLTEYSLNDTTDKITYSLSENLVASKSYILHFVYSGSMDDDMHGFYRSSYTDSNNVVKWIGSTQFETNHARRAFPAFDEPKFKATFDISLVRHKSMKSVSNTRLIASGATGDYVTDLYEQTPVMSTYIIAFLISEFTERTDNQFSVVARAEYYDQSEYSFNVGRKLLSHFDTYFGIKYYEMGINKMHMAAIPDFSAGAMENWGLLTYRERALLYVEGSTTLSAKQSIASIVAHEQAHMWFGDLVTCDWWSYTWLNEGFATYFQYFGTANVETELDMDKQFLVAQAQPVMNMDATANTNPMTDPNTNTPSDLSRMFNSISYNKGGTVIRMVKHVLGEQNFQKSLQEYLSQYKLQNAVPQNLFDFWIKYWPQNYAQYATPMLTSFTEQVGYPVLKIELASNGNSITINQSRFLLRDDDGADASLLYTVPITYTTDKEKDFSTTSPKLFLAANTNKQTVTLPTSANWLIANIQEVGYYRVNYDEATWHKIHHALFEDKWSGIHELNRAQIVDDLLNLARANHISYDLALEVLEYLSTELNYLPWTSALNGYSYLATRLGSDTKDFAKYILDITKVVYNTLGFDQKTSDTSLDIYNRAKILAWSCKYGNEACITEAKLRFQNMKTTAVPVNIRSVVYCTAMREGTLEDFNVLFEKYKTDTVATERTLILSSLGCVKEQSLIENYFNIIMSDDVRRQDKSSALSSLYSENNENVTPVFELVTKNVEKVAEQMGSYSSVATVISNIASLFTEESQQASLKEFNKNNKEKFGSSASTLESAENTVSINLRWAANRLVNFRTYLEKRGNGSATLGGFTLMTLLLVAMATMIFN